MAVARVTEITEADTGAEALRQAGRHPDLLLLGRDQRPEKSLPRVRRAPGRRRHDEEKEDDVERERKEHGPLQRKSPLASLLLAEHARLLLLGRSPNRANTFCAHRILGLGCYRDVRPARATQLRQTRHLPGRGRAFRLRPRARF